MSIRPVSTHLSLDIRRPKLGGVRETLQASNIAFKSGLYNMAVSTWTLNNISSPVPRVWPFRAPPGMPAYSQLQNNATRMDLRYSAVDDGPTQGYNSTGLRGNLGSTDYPRFRMYTGTPGSQLASAVPVTFGAVLLTDQTGSRKYCVSGGANVLSLLDIGTTQIGPSYTHPTYTGTVSITAGQPYLNSFSGGLPLWFWNVSTNLSNVLHIDSGPDKGVYTVQHYDVGSGSSARLYLRNPDGTPFNPSSSQTGVVVSIGVRSAYFNEVGVIPNSRGSLSTGGVFSSDDSRTSYIIRTHFEKSGSTSPTDSRQKGTYWLSARQWLCGDGSSNSSGYYTDAGCLNNGGSFVDSSTTDNQGGGFWFNLSSTFGSGGGTDGVPVGFAFDETNQRLWMATASGYTGSLSSICYWLYKTPESVHEISSSGTAGGLHKAELSSPIAMSNVIARDIHIGSDGTVYVCLSVSQLPGGGSFTNVGIAAVHPDFTTQQVFAGSTWGLTATNVLAGMAIDRSRNRTSTGTSTVSANHVTCATGAFTASDLGRFIDLSGLGTDNGIFKISAVNSSTDVTVTTKTGVSVAFSGGAGGTFSIGDRLYLAWNDVVTQVSKIYYVETTDLTVLNSVSVSMTNGATLCTIEQWGQFNPLSVDQFTGNLYWGSSDTAAQINVFDPTAGAVTSRALSSFSGLNGGSGTTPTTPAQVLDIRVNNAKSQINQGALFNDLWVATDQGTILLDKTSFSGTYKHYWGTAQGHPYVGPAGQIASNGSTTGLSGSTHVKSLCFGIDGRVYGLCVNQGINTYPDIVQYGRESDNWLPGLDSSGGSSLPTGTYGMLPSIFMDPYGGAVTCFPGASLSDIEFNFGFLCVSVHYQWDSASSKWYPKEVVRGGIPDGISSPGCLAKPLHSTMDPIIMGMEVQFTDQGGATPANNEFLGRMGQAIGYGDTDGASDSATATSHTFVGSGFTSSDVGRYLRIESGSNQNTYSITSYVDTNHITIRRWNNASFTMAGESGLTYTLWDIGSQGTGGNAGPEAVSWYAANGYARDNTQDIQNFQTQFFFSKTALYDQAEGLKFCTGVIGPPGSSGAQVFSEYFNIKSNQYEPGLPNHQALPAGVMSGWGGTPAAYASSLLNFMCDQVNDGTYGQVRTYTCPGNARWYGIYADSNTQGYGIVVDFGTAVEVGSILIRGESNWSGGPPGVLYTEHQNSAGLIGNWYTESSTGAAPAASSSVRCSGSANLSFTYRNGTISLPGGDPSFLGSSVLGPLTDGATTQYENTLVCPASTFTPASSSSRGHLGMIVQLTTGSDAGYYRITGISTDGSTATVTNLDQTVVAWVGSGGSLHFSVFDGVQDGDLLAITTAGNTAHRLSVERLLTINTAQIRVLPSVTLASQSWNCLRPTWSLVKRISYSSVAAAPDVSDNGTWGSVDGKERGLPDNPLQDFKIFADLSDLPTWQRSGRYWKWGAMPRFSSSPTGDQSQFIDSLEFYDPLGNRIGVTRYNSIDATWDDPTFIANQHHRFDFIQASDTATGISGMNGLVSVGGSNFDTVTLTGSNRFIGFQVRPPGTAATAAGGSNVFTAGSSDPGFQTSDPGRILRVTNNANAGYYRILAVTSSTTVTVVTPNGSPVTLAADTGGTTVYTLHEGINTGTSNPDYLALTTGGIDETNLEAPILSISNDLKTIVLGLTLGVGYSSQNWEIRRRAFENSARSLAPDATYSARALYSSNMAPVQSGDFSIDSRGSFQCYSDDIGQGNRRIDGAPQAGSHNFTGSGFCADDVGRLLQVSTGPNVGWYKISSVASPTSIGVITAYPAGVQTLGNFATDTGSQTYAVFGERRFRCARYTACLRS